MIVKTYTIVFFSLLLILAYRHDGEPYPSPDLILFKDAFCNMMLLLPLIGRVMEWW